jgi:hypothetical protein
MRATSEQGGQYTLRIAECGLKKHSAFSFQPNQKQPAGCALKAER